MSVPFSSSILGSILTVAATTISLWLPTTAEARLRAIEEADVKLELDNATYEVNADGTYVLTEEREFSSQNENGRMALSLERIPYEPGITKVQIKSAETINGTNHLAVDLATIKDQAVDAKKEGITNQRNLIIPFLGVTKTAHIHYTLVMTQLKPMVKGVFSTAFLYGAQFPEMKGTVTIRSPKRIVLSGSPHAGELSWMSTPIPVGGVYTASVTITKPIYRQVENENSPAIPRDFFPTVRVTTATGWNDLAKPLADGYEKEITKPLPPLFGAIAKEAATEKDDVAKVDHIISSVANQIVYVGEWTNHKRMLYPRGHKLVAASKTGDCKDFAVTTAAIMRKLGLKADVAITTRGTPNDRELRHFYDETPMLDFFNHAIVKWTKADGSVHWIDPTNVVAYSNGVMPDIAGASALTLAKTTTTIETIPDDSLPADMTIEKTVQFHADDTASTNGKLSFSGQLALSLKQLAQTKGKSTLDQVLWLLGTGERTPPRDSLNYDAASRSGYSLEVPIQYSGKTPIATYEGATYVSAPYDAHFEGLEPQPYDRATDIYLGPLGTTTSVTQMMGVNVEDEIVGSCYALNDVLELNREVNRIPGGIEVRDTIKRKQMYLKAADTKEKGYSSFLGQLDDCANNSFVKLESPKTALPPSSPKDPTKDDSKEKTRLASGKEPPKPAADFDRGPPLLTATAADAFKMATEAAFDHRFYKLNKARRIFNRLITENPKNTEAYAGLSVVYRKLGYVSGNDYGKAYLAESLRLANFAVANEPQKTVASYRSRAWVEYALKNYNNAARDFGVVYSLAPKESDNFELGGKVALGLGDKAGAEKWYLAYVAGTTSDKRSGAYDSLGNFYLDIRNYPRSQDAFKKSLELNPKSAWTWHNLAIAQMYDMRNDDAIESERKALGIAQFGAANFTLSTLLADKASKLIEGKPTAKAQDLAEVTVLEALKLNPDNPVALKTITLLYMSELPMSDPKEKMKRGVSYAEHLAKVDPNEQGFYTTYKSLAAQYEKHPEMKVRSPAAFFSIPAAKGP